ncbi:monooxygenase flavin-binding family protein-like protein [Apiospora sp. TS-2023a]
MSNANPDLNTPETFDVVIIGAGFAGINCAYRLLKQQPGTSFVILDGRDSIGGVWDQFRYPGVRSDSQVYTYGLAWHRWPFTKPIAEGSEIMEYLHDAVSKHRIENHIRFRHKVSGVDWSSERQEWAVTAAATDYQGQERQSRRYLARWIIMGTGYVDYESPIDPDIPGLDTFKGRVVHPQNWPRDFSYANQKLALIGSGARPTSPHDRARRRRRGLTKDAAKELPAHVPVDPHFTPRYDPWRQRLCLDPNAAFFKAFHRPNVRLITGEIAAVADHGIRMRDGETVDADVIITATGHRMVLGGNIDIQVDGKDIAWGGRFVWNGCMLDRVPNLMFMLGYTNNSWTLGSDNTAMYLVRLMSYMRRKGVRSAVPRVPESVATRGTQSIWQLESTYVREAQGRLPVCGNTGPWKPKNRPPIDWLYARWGSATADLEFSM